MLFRGGRAGHNRSVKGVKLQRSWLAGNDQKLKNMAKLTVKVRRHVLACRYVSQAQKCRESFEHSDTSHVIMQKFTSLLPVRREEEEETKSSN